MIDDNYNGSVSLLDLWRAAVQSWHIILITTACALLIGIGYLLTKSPSYVASMTIANAQRESFGNSGTPASGVLSQLAGVSDQSSEKFAQFQTMLVSNKVAAGLADLPEVRPLLMPKSAGILHPHVPTAVDLRDNLSRILSIKKIDDDTVSLSVVAANPQEAVRILTAIYDQTDQAMRDTARVSAAAKISYLESRLQTVQNTTTRDVLIGLLSNEEVQLMFSESKTPYAASILDPPIVPDAPVSSTMIILSGSVLIGLIGGLSYALLHHNAQRK
jgi:uncharacterized protein involved in exopolysaccharide biosynthesis